MHSNCNLALLVGLLATPPLASAQQRQLEGPIEGPIEGPGRGPAGCQTDADCPLDQVCRPLIDRELLVQQRRPAAICQPDLEPPTLALGFRADGGTFKIEVTAVATDNRVVDRIEVDVDGEPFSTLPDGVSTRQQVVVVVPAEAGSHTIEVRAFDGRGQLVSGRQAVLLPQCPARAAWARCEQSTNNRYTIHLQPGDDAVWSQATEDLEANAEALVRALEATGVPADQIGVVDCAPPPLMEDPQPPNARRFVLRRPDRPKPPDPFDVVSMPGPCELPFEGFDVRWLPRRATIRAGDPRGQRYAVGEVMKGFAPGVPWANRQVTDAPVMRLRALHVGEETMAPEVEALVDQVVAARLNVLSWETRGNLDLPEMGPALRADVVGYTRTDVRNLVERATAAHVVLIPALKLFSHQEKLLGSRDWAAQCPGLRVIDCVGEAFGCDVMAGEVNPGNNVMALTYNPDHPVEVVPGQPTTLFQGFILPLLDAYVELFTPDHRHLPAMVVGHDETTHLQLWPLFGAQGATVFARHLAQVTAYLASQHDVDTLAWGDMFLDPALASHDRLVNTSPYHMHEFGGADPMDELRLHDVSRLRFIDWQYFGAHTTEYPSNDYLARSGFTTYSASWYQCPNIGNLVADELDLPDDVPGYAPSRTGMFATSFDKPFTDIETIIPYSGATFWTGVPPGDEVPLPDTPCENDNHCAPCGTRVCEIAAGAEEGICVPE